MTKTKNTTLLENELIEDAKKWFDKYGESEERNLVLTKKIIELKRENSLLLKSLKEDENDPRSRNFMDLIKV